MPNSINNNPNIPGIPESTDPSSPLKHSTQNQHSTIVSESAAQGVFKQTASPISTPPRPLSASDLTSATSSPLAISSQKASSLSESILSPSASQSSDLDSLSSPTPKVSPKLAASLLSLFQRDDDDADYALVFLEGITLPKKLAGKEKDDPEVVDYRNSVLKEVSSLAHEGDTNERTIENLLFIATLHDLKNKGTGLSKDRQEVLTRCYSSMKDSLARGRLCELLARKPQMFQMTPKVHLISSLLHKERDPEMDVYKVENDALNAFIGSMVVDPYKQNRERYLKAEALIRGEKNNFYIPLKEVTFPAATDQNTPTLGAKYKPEGPQIVEINLSDKQIVPSDLMGAAVQFLNENEFYEGDIYTFLEKHGNESLSGDQLLKFCYEEGFLEDPLAYEKTRALFKEGKNDFERKRDTQKLMALLSKNPSLTKEEIQDLKKIYNNNTERLRVIRNQLSDLNIAQSKLDPNKDESSLDSVNFNIAFLKEEELAPREAFNEKLVSFLSPLNSPPPE